MRYCRCQEMICLAIIALIVLCMLSGCANPVGVDRVSPQQSYQLSTANPMGSEELRYSTIAVLQRYDLHDTYSSDLPKTILFLHDQIRTDERRDLLFALAELSYLHGTKLQKGVSDNGRQLAHDFFLQTAVYAYAYLLCEGREPLPSAYDVRFREACDLYNRSLWQAFPENPDHSLNISEGARNITGGRLLLTLKTEKIGWDMANIAGFFPSDAYKVHGFTVLNRNPGLGLPLIGQTRKTVQSPHGGVLPVTAFLRIPGGLAAVSTGDFTAELELYSAFETAEVKVAGRLVPLETDTTTPLAYVLNKSDLWNVGVKRFVGGDEVNRRILLIQPYIPGRIPVVFVHGTASSPVWWAEMLNTLRADPAIRQKFQFWFYQYNTSNMIVLSAAILRETLTDMMRSLDPQQQDPALQQMVVIGHSQGGLLTKMMAVNSGETIWRSMSDKDLDQIGIDSEVKAFIRRVLFFDALPFVKRVVFISTPHRGSFLTTGWVRKLVRNIITFPVDILTVNFDDIRRITSMLKVPAVMRSQIPTSLDGMSADNPVLQTLADLPLAPWVTGHSIIAVEPGMAIESGNDGVVEYSSAHLDGVKSELVVRSSHSCQGHPFTIEEVRRILLEHIGITSSMKKTGDIQKQ